MERPSDRLLVRPEHAVLRSDEWVFVEAVPWRTAADDPAFHTATVPGAHRAHVRTTFAGSPNRGTGHLPLPSRSALRRTAARWVAGRDSNTIVLFTRDPRDLASATRAWFTLSWAGVGDVRLLLGGLEAWKAAGGLLGPAAPPQDRDPQDSAPPPLRFTDEAWPVRVITALELTQTAKIGTVLDARPRAHYSGFSDDPRSGHVPGAVSSPASDLLRTDGSLHSPRRLRRWLLDHGAIGPQRVAAYCHGGVASSSLVFGGALLGQPIALYVDSWSAWAQDFRLPVAVGSERGLSPSDRFSCFDPL